MKPINFNLLFGLFFGILAVGCSDKNEIPVDADDNFITSVVLSVNDKTYDAVIENNTITMTVPYTVSLDGAKASFIYTPSAKIFPDPTSITDWNTERTFRVTSFNGATNDYTYVVVKDEIRSEGDVELKKNSEVAAFIESGVTIIKGNLIIGSDAENAENISDISGLSIIKEVEGTITIKNSYTGGTLTGLDNITKIGGLSIGSEENPAANETLEMVSMTKLNEVTGNIHVYNNGVKFVQFDLLKAIEGDFVISSSTLTTLQIPELINVGGALNIFGMGKGAISTLVFPKVQTVKNSLSINEISTLKSISFPELIETGSINFSSLPIEFEKLSMPKLSVVNGDCFIISNYIQGDLFSTTGNVSLTNLDEMSNLATVTGLLSICYFDELSSLSNLKNLKRIGSLKLEKLISCSSPIDISDAVFSNEDSEESIIRISECKKLQKLITKDDLSNVSVDIHAYANSYVDFNFKKVKKLSYRTPDKKVFTLPIEEVHGDFYFGAGMKSGIIANNLKFVDGYMHLKIGMMVSNLEFSKLEKIGGQFFMEGTLNTPKMVHNFSNLKSICCNSNPSYAKEGKWSTNDLPYGGLDIRSTTTYELFPVLEKVGGAGITIHGFSAFSCPELVSIAGSLSADAASKLTSFDMPKLKSLSGVNFVKLTSFSDFSIFETFIRDNQITEPNWVVSGCKYNPTYQDMKDGRYKPAE